jgi:acylphosphatase
LKYQTDGKVMAFVQGNDASVKEFEEATGLAVKFGDMRSMMGFPAPRAQEAEERKTQRQLEALPSLFVLPRMSS